MMKRFIPALCWAVLVISPVFAWQQVTFFAPEIAGIFTDDFNRESIGDNWLTLAYLDDLTINTNRVTASTYPPGGMARWTGISLGPNHSAEIEYLSGSGSFELGVRDVQALPDMAFTDNFDRADGALGGAWNDTGMVISSNAVATVTEAEGTYYDPAIEADQFAAMTVTAFGGWVYLVVRGDSDPPPAGHQNAYLFAVNASSEGTRTWNLIRVNSGTGSTLDTGTVEVGGDAISNEMYFVVQGSDPVVLWCVWANKVVTRYEDGAANRITAGYPGMALTNN